ncbi:CubicO group peptidase, beta-lactamase class C family [Terribacillus aidingensis]|uniref:CubicO group peptidase, beta-lactamase class C family n=1 Tax=Terribacillus aidingensis TaxID=586416 RepID=A0A285N0P7_9BACI|nr:penicillin binding protein PBP4B [Terribacillus aidingensis]SNZ02503.1 CubicO group peptidase, beta-lactamase class C family [Terribacillus aidingensis]
MLRTGLQTAFLALVLLLVFVPTEVVAVPNESTMFEKAKTPEEAGFTKTGLAKVDQLIENDIENGFPGASLIIIKDGKIVKESRYGYRQVYDGLEKLKHPKKLKKETLYDLASNTKMYATNFALQHLVSTGQIALTDKVSDYIPEFKDKTNADIKGKDTILIQDLLQHQAGFPASIEFHDPSAAGVFYSQNRDRTIEYLPQVPLEYEPRTNHLYSDIDYMLLGVIVERVTGKQLDAFVEETFYQPLQLKNTMFKPLDKGVKKKDIAATERLGNTRDGYISFPHIRQETIIGEVHDEKSYYAMEGIAGHAGLFSTTTDMAVLLQVMLNGGDYGTHHFFDEAVIDQFTAASSTNDTYGLGWRRNGSGGTMEWMFGSLASEAAYGHTGWTGTVTIIDPAYDLGIVLLTNKKHTPVVNPEQNSNLFAGDEYATGDYGPVVQAIYEAMK